MTKAWMKCNQFWNDQRGDAVGWVVGIFITVVLFIVVYAMFKPQIEEFIKTQIFGRMNGLQ
ncbi:hypothetical protein D3C74_91010 [compost metagenome]